MSQIGQSRCSLSQLAWPLFCAQRGSAMVDGYAGYPFGSVCFAGTLLWVGFKGEPKGQRAILRGPPQKTIPIRQSADLRPG